MPRPRHNRNIMHRVVHSYFSPAGIQEKDTGEVALSREEFEAVRLKDYKEMDQTEIAQSMGISQPTLHRTLKSARQKIAQALVLGCSLRIVGGSENMRRYLGNQGDMPGLGRGRGRGMGMGRMQNNASGRGMGYARALGAGPVNPVEQPNQENIPVQSQHMLEQGQEVVVSASGNTLEDMVDPRFGRCAFFLHIKVHESNLELLSSWENKSAALGRGAGIEAAQNVAATGVKAVITGRVGPNAQQVLDSAGVKAVFATGKVRDAVLHLVKQ